MMIRVKLEQDLGPMSPGEWDNLGTFAIWHRRYVFGDEQPDERPHDYFRGKRLAACLPVYLYDHSGLALRAGRSFSDIDPGEWDSGCVGYIYMTRADMLREFGDNSKANRERAEAALRAVVESWDTYLRGDVWGYTIERVTRCEKCGQEEEEFIDSCWGFYGSDPRENGMLEQVEAEYRATVLAAYENDGEATAEDEE